MVVVHLLFFLLLRLYPQTTEETSLKSNHINDYVVDGCRSLDGYLHEILLFGKFEIL